MNQNPNVTPQIVQPAAPAAGAGVVLTVPQMAGMPEQAPPSQWWRVQLGNVQLVTSATVANRLPLVTIADQLGHVLYNETTTVAVAASATTQVGIAASDVPALAVVPATGGLQVVQLVVPRLWLPSGYTITISAQALQAGDQFSNVSFLIDQIG